MQAKEMNRVTDEFKKSLNIKYNDKKQLVNSLSGGNQQKICLAKAFALEPKFLFVSEPTRGIDVAAKAEIYRIMCELAGQGIAIIMISSELPEVLGMSDRIAVMCGGRVAGELSRSEATQEKIMFLAAGGT